MRIRKRGKKKRDKVEIEVKEGRKLMKDVRLRFVL